MWIETSVELHPDHPATIRRIWRPRFFPCSFCGPPQSSWEKWTARQRLWWGAPRANWEGSKGWSKGKRPILGIPMNGFNCPGRWLHKALALSKAKVWKVAGKFGGWNNGGSSHHPSHLLDSIGSVAPPAMESCPKDNCKTSRESPSQRSHGAVHPQSDETGSIHHGISMDFYGISMGFLWISMDFYGFLWFPLHSPWVSPWNPLDSALSYPGFGPLGAESGARRAEWQALQCHGCRGGALRVEPNV